MASHNSSGMKREEKGRNIQVVVRCRYGQNKLLLSVNKLWSTGSLSLLCDMIDTDNEMIKMCIYSLTLK